MLKSNAVRFSFTSYNHNAHLSLHYIYIIPIHLNGFFTTIYLCSDKAKSYVTECTYACAGSKQSWSPAFLILKCSAGLNTWWEKDHLTVNYKIVACTLLKIDSGGSSL